MGVKTHERPDASSGRSHQRPARQYRFDERTRVSTGGGGEEGDRFAFRTSRMALRGTPSLTSSMCTPVPKDGGTFRFHRRHVDGVHEPSCSADDQSSSTKGRAQGGGTGRTTRKIAGLPQSSWRNRRDSGPRSPAHTLSSATPLPSGLEPPPAKPPHSNPPIPLFKIPPAQWPIVLQRVAQGESLRQIARSYHTSYEAVRRVLNAARKQLVVGDGDPSAVRADEGEQ